MGQKPKAKRNDIKLSFLRADRFGVVECQNRIKYRLVVPIQSWDKSGVLAYFWPKIGQIF